MNLPDWLLLISGLLAAAVLLGLAAPLLRLPLSVLLALAGLIGGVVGRRYGLESPLRAERFELAVQFLFLPVLVFEAALGLSVRAFFANLGAIATLALPAVLLSAGLVGAVLHWALGLSWAVALLFGAIVAATDPVAVVAVFRKLGVPERLLILVEGESLLNDGVAIVLASVLLLAALKTPMGLDEAALRFFVVFFGGIAAGTLLGLLAALMLPWLDALAATALSLALAYGGFIAAEHVGGLSGVTTALAAGLTLKALLPSRAGPEPRQALHLVWGSLGYVANALLFLLIGLAIDFSLLRQFWPVILLTLATVLLIRGITVAATLAGVERFAGLPQLGRRNQAVLIWGGLRGGVALALALSLPAELAQRELLVALTGGVVLGTLLLNATTVGALAHRLGLDRPTRAQRFLAASARLAGVYAAQARLSELALEAPQIEAALQAEVLAAQRQLSEIRLEPPEELAVVTHRSLFVERDTYQRLGDAGLLPPTVTRTLLHEVDDHIEETCAGAFKLSDRRRHVPRFDRLVESLLTRLPPPSGIDPEELVYHEASARRLAARRTVEALELMAALPNVRAESVRAAQAVFGQWEREAEASLARFHATARPDFEAVYRHQAEILGRIAARDELQRLVNTGLLPPQLAAQAAGEISSRWRTE
jgi:CPA1 family monovalent cation:H+ antiporter